MCMCILYLYRCADTKAKDIWMTDILLTDNKPIYTTTERQEAD